MLLGIPLLYTMEVWQLGVSASPSRLLVGLLVLAVPVFLLVRLQGFWSTPARGVVDATVQTVQAVGIALVSVAVVLLVLRRVTWSMPLADVAGHLIFEAAPFAIGAGIAATALRAPADDRRSQRTTKDDARSTGRDLGATALGALVIGLSIAPTDEVPTIAADVTVPWLLALMALSLVTSYIIVFAAGFLDQQKRRQQVGLFQHPVTETLASYLVALAVSAAMLWYFDNLALDGPPQETLGRIIVLGLPAAVGGGAGRVVV